MSTKSSRTIATDAANYNKNDNDNDEYYDYHYYLCTPH